MKAAVKIVPPEVQIPAPAVAVETVDRTHEDLASLDTHRKHRDRLQLYRENAQKWLRDLEGLAARHREAIHSSVTGYGHGFEGVLQQAGELAAIREAISEVTAVIGSHQQAISDAESKIKPLAEKYQC